MNVRTWANFTEHLPGNTWSLTRRFYELVTSRQILLQTIYHESKRMTPRSLNVYQLTFFVYTCTLFCVYNDCCRVRAYCSGHTTRPDTYDMAFLCHHNLCYLDICLLCSWHYNAHGQFPSCQNLIMNRQARKAEQSTQFNQITKKQKVLFA